MGKDSHMPSNRHNGDSFVICRQAQCREAVGFFDRSGVVEYPFGKLFQAQKLSVGKLFLESEGY